MPNMDNENGNMENTIIELNTTDEETSLLTDTSEALEISDTELKVKTMPKRAERNKKKSFKEKWHDLPKQAKIAIIVIPIVILLIVIGLLLYFFVFKKDEEKKLDPDETIVFEKGNYKYENGFLIFTDDNDEELGKYECKDKDVEKCYLAELSNEDDFDTIQYQNDKGEEITKTSKVILKRYAFVFDDDKITLYDIKEEKTHGDYELIKTGDIDKNYVVVKDQDDKYGILSFEANSYHVLIPSDYDYIGIINNPSVFVAKKDGSSFLIDDTNKTLTANMNGDIKNFNAKYVSLSNGIKYTLYDYKGNAVMEDSDIEYIDFKDNYVFTIKDNRLYAFDDSLSKLTETGIKLKDAEYRTIYVFDDKNNYQETKSAYTITSDTSKIIVETDGKEKEINVYEGAISKTLPFVNYFDGSLFFYADEEKQDLIGSYTCSNKNTVTSSTKSLDNCFIAQAQNIVNDTANVGFIPIINKKYAFIRDTGSMIKTKKLL